jgi:hypothetical protein
MTEHKASRFSLPAESAVFFFNKKRIENSTNISGRKGDNESLSFFSKF